jgi:hypothetical protein
MFPDLPACDVGTAGIEALVGLMEQRTGDSGNNPRIPAGFTYLGQFVDHDISFDPTRLDLPDDAPPPVNLRTPRLDLDSVYGAGPVVHPFLYDWREAEPPGTRLLVGHNAVDATRDLPRNQQGRALIGDPRNDENLIVAQLHLLFIRFHNAVVDHLWRAGEKERELFEAARRLVRWHYQWIVVHELLPKVTGETTFDREHFQWDGQPFIPVEFSGAAYRFGHSMVRGQYGLQRLTGGPPPRGLPIFPDLAGFRWLPKSLVIDWERFFEREGLREQAQSSQKIDTALVAPLFRLPDREPVLPRRNLLRGVRLKLASGQDVARALDAPVLEEADLRLDGIDETVRKGLLRSTPLWYYILCEAEKRPAPAGRHLGPAGGRIVGAVLGGLIEGDPDSYVNQTPPWRPGALGTGADFTMATLVDFAQGAPPSG